MMRGALHGWKVAQRAMQHDCQRAATGMRHLRCVASRVNTWFFKLRKCREVSNNQFTCVQRGQQQRWRQQRVARHQCICGSAKASGVRQWHAASEHS
jgi:hypothetical protein